jgi:predicted dehydrogenase
MSRAFTASHGLLIGAGSVGKRHATVMARRYPTMTVIDVNEDALIWARTNLPNVVATGTSLDEFSSEILEHSDQTTAVIASWGPHHFEAFMKLVGLGVRRIFCEKPIAVSLRQLQLMREFCVKKDVSFTAGLHLRYRGVTKQVNDITRTHLGGPPTSIVVDGGARCIATNGTHWLDLAIAIFGAPPMSVVADIDSAPVNPRSPELLYWGGAASWKFPGGARFTINYDNASSVHERVRVYARNGVVDIDSSFNIRGFRRNSAEIENDQRVARTGDVMTDAPIAEYVTEFNEVLSLQLDEIEGRSSPLYSSSDAFGTAEALVAAFEASRLGKSLTIPVHQDIIDSSTEWNIS